MTLQKEDNEKPETKEFKKKKRLKELVLNDNEVFFKRGRWRTQLFFPLYAQIYLFLNVPL